MELYDVPLQVCHAMWMNRIEPFFLHSCRKGPSRLISSGGYFSLNFGHSSLSHLSLASKSAMASSPQFFFRFISERFINRYSHPVVALNWSWPSCLAKSSDFLSSICSFILAPLSLTLVNPFMRASSTWSSFVSLLSTVRSCYDLFTVCQNPSQHHSVDLLRSHSQLATGSTQRTVSRNEPRPLRSLRHSPFFA